MYDVDKDGYFSMATHSDQDTKAKIIRARLKLSHFLLVLTVPFLFLWIYSFNEKKVISKVHQKEGVVIIIIKL